MAIIIKDVNITMMVIRDVLSGVCQKYAHCLSLNFFYHRELTINLRLHFFLQIETYLLHFWQGLPEHLFSLMTIDMSIDIICICDSILHKVFSA